jgi:hypothetical protein
MLFSINEKLKFLGSYFKLLLSPFLRLLHTFSFSCYLYQKDERAKPENLVTSDAFPPPPHAKCLSLSLALHVLLRLSVAFS